jgi:alkaline phosphatase
MNSHFDFPARLARRDWLKAAGLAATAMLQPASAANLAPPSTQASRPRGVVFLVSDGMSPGVLTLAQAFSMLTRKRGTSWCELMNRPGAAHGLMDTASASSLVTDSAAASSAWGSGQRVANGSINVSPEGKALEPIAKILKSAKGGTAMRVGLVTTATVTHATPAGFAANSSSRGDENAIAPQYLDRVDVILGGGSGYFDPSLRPDHRDLSADFGKAGYHVVRDRDALLASRQEKLLGCFTRGYIPYDIDRRQDPELARKTPTLAEMAAAALDRFLGNPAPFLLQIEGARIDHAAHLNDIAGLLGEQLAFDDALGVVLAKLQSHPDVLVVVTSDHGNSNPGLNGMGGGYKDSTPAFEKIARAKASHEAVLQRWNQSPGNDPAMLVKLVREHIGFTLKDDEVAALMAMRQRQPTTEWNHQLEKPEGLLGQFTGNHNGIGWTGTSHTSDPTIVTATGPGAERFSGMVRNTDVFRHLTELLQA